VDVRRVVALAVASGVHAAVLGALGAVKVHPRAVDLSEPIAAELDLELSEAIRPASVPTARADGAPVATHGTPALAAAERLEPDRASRATTEVPPNGDEPPVEPPPGDWSFPTGPLRIDVRAAVTPDLVAPAGGREPLPDGQPRGSRTGGVAEGLAEHDVELGLGRGGPILTAVESAARSGDAPADGSATFEVFVFADGAVTVRLVSADGDAGGWARVGESAAHSVPPGHVRVPPGTRGWRVVLRVDATTRLADGRAVRSLHGPRASLEPSALQAAMEKKPGAEDPPPPVVGPSDGVGMDHEPRPVGAVGQPSSPKGAGAVAQAIVQRVLPTPTLSVSGKICSAAVSPTPVGVSVGGGCSLENIGTRTTRTVSGRILSEGPLR
jgi:hypothetical protein